MKTQTTERQVTVSAGETASFKSSHTGKLVGMLFSGLYENKPQSILRELWSNALDAHASVGRAHVPFDVTFPTVFESVFRVRDYGPGMSHEMIMTDYIDPGYSSKEETNDEVGKFGIGSKSPFSYTDVYTLISYDGTEARHYSIIDMGQGEYTANLMATTPDTSPSGIEVTFPIDTGDVRAFRKAAQRVSYGFEVKPNVLNDDEFEGWVDLPVVTDGDGWKLLNGALEGYGGTAYAKMGCVLYPINVEALDNLSSDEAAFLQSTVIIDFPVGDLEITPSRESLSYGRNEPTAKSITNRVRTIVSEVVDGILADYEKCATYWDAVVKFRQHVAMNLPECILKLVRKNAMWKGQRLEQHIRVSRTVDAYRALDFCELSGKALDRRTYRFNRYQDKLDIEPTDKTVMIIEDLSLPVKDRAKRVAARIRGYARENSLRQVVWVKFYGSSKQESEAFVGVDGLLEGIEVLYATDIVEPARETYSGGTRSPVMVRLMNEHAYRDFDEKVELSPDEMDEGGIMIRLERNQPQYDYKLAHPQTMVRILRQMGVIDSDQKVYGVPKTLWKGFEGEQWVDLYDLARESYAETDGADAALRARAINTIRQNSILRSLSDYLDTSLIDPQSDAIAAVEFFHGVKNEDTSQANTLLEFVRAMGDESKLEGTVAELEEMEFHAELMEESYPLIEMICTNYRYSQRDKLVDMLAKYIYTCDVAAETIRHKATANAAAA